MFGGLFWIYFYIVNIVFKQLTTLKNASSLNQTITIMQIDVLETSYPDVKSETLVLGIFEDDLASPPVKWADETLKGSIARAVQKKQFLGDFKAIKTYLFNTKPEHLVLVGLGKRADWSLERLRKVAAISAKTARALGKDFATDLHRYGPATPFENAKAVTIGTTLGLYQFTRYKTQSLDKIKTVEHITLLDIDKQKADLARGVNEGTIIAESVIIARDLVNTPSKDLPPKMLAQEAKRILKLSGVSVDVWDKKDIEKKGMNALLGVGKGSTEDPCFIIIEYGSKKQKPIVLAGKGICFDTGGYSIKVPSTSMLGMKMDMAGGAAVISAIRAAALLKLPHHIIGLIPAADNAISGAAQRPDDVVKAFNGKTIEVANTDAEGRLVLADALSYAQTLQPKAIIDLATLTGACMVALGFNHAGLFSRDNDLMKRIIDAGAITGDTAWPLPMGEEYDELIKSDIADVRNISKDGYAGAIVGAVFLQQFVDTKTPYAHLDIAGPAFLPDEREYNGKSATGCGVRLLVELLQRWEPSE